MCFNFVKIEITMQLAKARMDNMSHVTRARSDISRSSSIFANNLLSPLSSAMKRTSGVRVCIQIICLWR